MRVNTPITNREYDYDGGHMLVSTTDLKGRITYANPAFIAVSGYEYDELMGKAHNLVRHPDMPPEAFDDLWNTIKSGQPWTALVKNRRRDGDHYWVSANVTPILENGAPVGYMSVRIKPSCAQIDVAEKLYAEMRGGRANHLKIQRGTVVHRGMAGWWRAIVNMPLAFQIWGAFAVLAVGMVAADVSSVAIPTPATWIWAVGSLIGAGIIAAWLTSRIVKPIRMAMITARRIAGGDLSERTEVSRDDDIGNLQRALTQTTVNMMALVFDVKQQVSGMRTATGEIAIGNNDLSSRTEQTASNLEETASAMEQITSTVKQSADAARQADQLVSAASEIASRGGEVVGEVVKTMDDMTKSSKKISDIIGVIDGIAFQTNILALNAAVEAARAGEQGRGFAVVASEVRSLAQRSAEAAKEIKSLISASVERVESGAKLVGNAGATMQDIVASVQRVSDSIGEISAAAREQSTGITEVNQAVGQLDQMTQQNAALVEQSAAAAESLKDQADRLADAVAIFKMQHEVGAVASSVEIRRASVLAKKVIEKVASPKLGGKVEPTFNAKKPDLALKHAARATDSDWEEF